MFALLQAAIVLIISVVALVASIYAAIHAGRTPTSAFPAADKQSKALWLSLMVVAAVLAFVSLPWPLGKGDGVFGILGLIALAAVIFYLVDVKPKVTPHSGGSGTPRNNNRGTW